MASKTHLLIFLSIAIMATSIADAQILSPVRLNLSAIVNCTVGGGPAPPFPNATVLLQCLPGINIATTTTNSSGAFNFNLSVLPVLLPLLPTCRVVVATPLVSCNASLPTVGRLVGPINIVGLSINNGIIVILANVLRLTLNLNTGIRI